MAHHVTNIVLDEQPDRTVRALSKYLGVMADGSVASGTYRDTIRLGDDGWRITHHRPATARPPPAMTAFWVDEEFDRQHGAGGEGRYEAAVRERRDDFADVWGDISPVAFAVTAWALAVRLEPGFVRWHRRIISATCRRNSWDGGLTGAVTIVAPWPAELTWTRQWTRDRGWRNWPQLFGQYVTPNERDLAHVPHLRAQLVVEAPIPLADLPSAPEHRDDSVEHAARRAVVVIVRELNELLGPMLTQLDADAPTGR